MTKELLTIDEVAEMLKVSKRHVHKLKSRKTIPFMKVGDCLRFDGDKVLEALVTGNG